MADTKKPIEKTIKEIAEILENGPLADLQPFQTSAEMAATLIVVRRLSQGRMRAEATSYCLVAGHPIRERPEQNISLSATFWGRWLDAPDERRFVGPDWQWTNGNGQPTGEVARGVALDTNQSDALVKSVGRLVRRGSGGRPPAYPHSEAAAAVTAEILALSYYEQQRCTGLSISVLLEEWYKSKPSLQTPDVSMLEKEATAILRGFKSSSRISRH